MGRLFYTLLQNSDLAFSTSFLPLNQIIQSEINSSRQDRNIRIIFKAAAETSHTVDLSAFMTMFWLLSCTTVSFLRQQLCKLWRTDGISLTNTQASTLTALKWRESRKTMLIVLGFYTVLHTRKDLLKSNICHRITELKELQGTSRDHWVYTPYKVCICWAEQLPGSVEWLCLCCSLLAPQHYCFECSLRRDEMTWPVFVTALGL